MANCKSCINGSDSEFHVNSGSGRVGSLYLWAGLGRVKQIEPTSSSAPLPLYESIRQLPGDRGWGNFQANISSPGGGYFDFREPTAPLLSTAGVTVPQLSFFILYDYTVSQTSCAFLCHNFVKFQQISLSSGTWLKLHAV